MDYVGMGSKLSPTDIADVAATINCSESRIRAILEIEAAGSGFDAAGHPTILFEPHKFWKHLGDTPKRKIAFEKRLAYPQQGSYPYPKNSTLKWKTFMDATRIDEHAAIKSASWGLGQIMGENYHMVGYASPEEMVTAFCESERNQLQAIIEYLKTNHLDDDLRAGRWVTVAEGYNGPNQAKNRYADKLKAADARWAIRLKTNIPVTHEDDGILRMGMKNSRVEAMQAELNKRKYFTDTDGKFGTETRNSVLAWQADNGRPLDMSMDAEDLALLERSPERPIPIERAEAPVAEIKKESGIVKKSDTAQNTIIGTSVVGAAAKVAEKSGLLDKATDTPVDPSLLDQASGAADKVTQASGIFDTVKSAIHTVGLDKPISFIAENEWLLFIGAAGVIAYLIYRIKQLRVDMHRNGEVV